MKPQGWPYKVYMEHAVASDGRSGRDALIAYLQAKSREDRFNGFDDGFSFRVGDVLDWLEGIESPGGRHVDEQLAASIK